jgi:dethiobiotin synthetase
LNLRHFFVTGTGTDIGKTYVTAGLIRAVSEAGGTIDALKPVMSGFDLGRAEQSDAGILLAALRRSVDEANLAAISPWRFTAPLAPDLAARQEKRVLEYKAVRSFCAQRLAAIKDHVLLEGVGGILSPIAESMPSLRLAADLGVPALLVCGTYLGALSHCLTAIETAKAWGVPIEAVIANETPGAPLPLAVFCAHMAEFTQARIFPLGREDATPFSALARELGLC